MTADNYVSLDDQVLLCSDLTTDDVVEVVVEKRDATNDQTSSDEGLAEKPSVTTTRNAVVALDAPQKHMSSLPDLAPQHQVDNGWALICHATVQKKIVDFCQLLQFKSDYFSSQYAYLFMGGQRCARCI